jgi:hypothetical protein
VSNVRLAQALPSGHILPPLFAFFGIILYIEFNPSNNLGYSRFYLSDKLVFSFANAALHNYLFLLL